MAVSLYSAGKRASGDTSTHSAGKRAHPRALKSHSTVPVNAHRGTTTHSAGKRAHLGVQEPRSDVVMEPRSDVET